MAPKDKMAKYGTIEQFDMRKPQNWPAYKERIEFFLEGNAIEDEQQKAVFLSVIGPELFDLAKSLCAPTKLKDESLEDIFTKLSDHFSPTPPEIAKRIIFERRNQTSNETAAEYVAKLRELAEDCNFGTNLDERLRDCLVGGIKDLAVQKRLLMEQKLTLDQAVKMINAAECSENHLSEIRNGAGSTSYNVHALSRNGPQRKYTERDHERGKQTQYKNSKRSCFRCDGQHSANHCRFKTSNCNFCHKLGHIEKACLNKKRRSKNSHMQNQIQESSSDEEGLFQVTTNRNIYGKHDPCTVTVILNGKEVVMEVDSGAAASVISNETFKTLWPKKQPKLYRPTNIYRDYQKNIINFLGQFNPTVKFQKAQATLPLLVTKSNNVNLLGRNWFPELGINVSVDQSVNAVHHTSVIEEVIKKHENIFNGQLESSKHQPVKLQVDPSIKPIKMKPRNIAFALKPKVESELKKTRRTGNFRAV